jgi:hypothetical protein
MVDADGTRAVRNDRGDVHARDKRVRSDAEGVRQGSEAG